MIGIKRLFSEFLTYPFKNSLKNFTNLAMALPPVKAAATSSVVLLKYGTSVSAGYTEMLNNVEGGLIIES